MARKKIVAGNWKMNMTPSEAVALVNTLKPLVASDETDVVFCVPAIDIIPVVEACKGTNIAVGAENMYYEEKGAYTGAERREGLFEQANHGTLLLDEINSMNISLQSKLLRVLQDGMVRHVGGVSEIRVDVRVLSNTNVPPYQAMEENKLRRDLFYRLGVVNLNIPPLRERMEDIPLLAKCFILNFNRKLLKNVIDIDAEVLNVFNSYDWPGNVRELQHAIEYAMNIMPEDVSTIILEYIPEHILGGQAPDIPIELKSSKEPSLENIMSNMEYRMLCKTLKENNGNISKTARVLGMSRQNIQYRIKRNKIDVQALISGRSPEGI